MDEIRGEIDASKQAKLQLLQKLLSEDRERKEEVSGGLFGAHNKKGIGRYMLVPLWVLVVMAAITVAWLYFTDRSTETSTPTDQPLVSTSSLGFFEYRSLRSCTTDHPLLNMSKDTGYSIDMLGYRNTQGFMAQFTKVEHFYSNQHLQCLAPVFESLRLPQANVFVIKLFAGPELRNYNLLDRHSFSSLKMNTRNTFLAHQADLIHIQVPCEGGTVRIHQGLKDHGTQTVHWTNSTQRPAPAEVISGYNMRLVIRGDSFIEMDRYNCSEKGDQGRYIGMLLEQYVLPETFLNHAPTFRFHTNSEIFELEFWPKIKSFFIIVLSITSFVHVMNEGAELKLSRIATFLTTSSITAILLMVFNWGR